MRQSSIEWKKSPLKIESPLSVLLLDDMRVKKKTHPSTSRDHEEDELRQSYFENILMQSASLMFEEQVQSLPESVTSTRLPTILDDLTTKSVAQDTKRIEELSIDYDETEKISLENNERTQQGPEIYQRAYASILSLDQSRIYHNPLISASVIEYGYEYLANVERLYPTESTFLPSLQTLQNTPHGAFSDIIAKVRNKSTRCVNDFSCNRYLCSMRHLLSKVYLVVDLYCTLLSSYLKISFFSCLLQRDPVKCSTISRTTNYRIVKNG
jgi:hypothetical protein